MRIRKTQSAANKRKTVEAALGVEVFETLKL
jgi:hypothetical protein